MPSLLPAQTIPLLEYKGGVNAVTPNKLDLKYATFENILNTRTDRYGQITKSWGYSKDNDTALSGSLRINNGTVFTKSDGTSYRVFASSTHIFTSLSGTYSSIISTITANTIPDMAVLIDELFIVDGSINMESWDGSTLTEYTASNSTNMVTASIIESAWGRLWFSGVSGNRSRVYYSEAGYPAWIRSQNLIDVSPDDGDIIKSLKLIGNSLYALKEFSTWEIYQTNAGEFGFAQVHPSIGCSYNTACTDFRGVLTVWSHRGIDALADGLNYTLLSAPINPYMEDLVQLNSGSSFLYEDDSTDFGAGSDFVNVDTTTYDGSVAMQYYESSNNSGNLDLYLANDIGNVRNMIRQKVIPESSITVDTIHIITGNNGCKGTFEISIRNSDMEIIVSSTSSQYQSGDYDLYATLSNSAFLTANATYYIVISTLTHTTSADKIFHVNYGAETTSHPVQFSGSNGASWSTFSNNKLWYEIFETTPTESSFTSQSLNATNASSWGVFSAEDTKPSGSSINYYVQTSTYDGFSSAAYIPVTNGQPIDSTTVPYIKWTSSFSRTVATAIPRVNRIGIEYYQTSSLNVPSMIEYDRCLYVAVSTNTDAQQNDEVLVLQTDASWTRYDWNVGAFIKQNNKLYFGDSANTGQIYRGEIKDLYTFDGNTYNSTYGGVFHDFGSVYKNRLDCLWVVADDKEGTLNVDYRFDGSLGSWSSLTGESMDFTNSQAYIKYTFPSLSVRAIQFRISSTSDFRVSEMFLKADDEYLKE